MFFNKKKKTVFKLSSLFRFQYKDTQSESQQQLFKLPFRSKRKNIFVKVFFILFFIDFRSDEYKFYITH